MKLVHGDSLDVLKEMEANSVDTIVTDPPYGLSFMGKKWDYDVPSVELWTECLRVLKPGGTMLCFAGSRTQHRMAVNVEDAGFDIKDTIMWLYGSGFPKSHNISINIDKTLNGMKHRGRAVAHAGTHHPDGTKHDSGKEVDEHKPMSEESQMWKGWHSHGLKPAYEPILVAVKPNSGTYANNALEWGVSGLNIDGGRIGTDRSSEPREYDRESASGMNCGASGFGTNLKKSTEFMDVGRFPANIILDEESGRLLDEQSGVSKGGSAVRKNNKDPYGSERTWSVSNTPAQETVGYTDKGGASRFFYCAKASKAERNAGCEGLEAKSKEYLRQNKTNDENSLKTGSGNDRTLLFKNNHPTVKPLKLMEYLCTLTKTPTGGTVLDPFMGSGTTGLACKNTGRDFIGIEREAEYIEIARARLGDN